MRFLVVSISLLAAAATALTAAQAQPGFEQVISLAPLEQARLPADLAAALPDLMEAALESDLRWEMIQAGSAPTSLTLDVSGSGPWKLSARTEKRSPPGRSAKASSGIEFSGMADLMQAVAELAGALDARLRDAQPGAITPLTRSLSDSTQAVSHYASGRQAIRSGKVPDGVALLERALEEDPAFTMAAAEIVLTTWVAGDKEAVRAAAQRLAAPRDGDSRMGAAVRIALSGLGRADAASIAAPARAMAEANPDLLWGRVLLAISQSLSGARSEALASWSAAATGDPADPRLMMGAGLAAMAAGELGRASEGFAAVRSMWPECLRAWTLQAEAQARQRDVPAARATVVAMKSWMAERGVTPTSDETHPDLMLGSLDLMEGHFRNGLKHLETLLAGLNQGEASSVPTATPLRAIVEMRRDLITSSDPVKRAVQVEDARRVVESFRTSLGPGAQQAPFLTELLRLEGLLQVKEGETVEAWKTVERIKTAQTEAMPTMYDAAYLSAMIMIKEGDAISALPMFQVAASQRGRLEDQMDLGRTQLRARRFPEARKTLDAIEARITSWDGLDASGLILPQPVVAMMIPIFYYTRASLAYDEGKTDESRRYFGMMLRYLREPDRELYVLAREARERGATPL